MNPVPVEQRLAIKRILLLLAACLAAGCNAAPSSTSSSAGNSAVIALKDMGSFHIGGRAVEITGKTPTQQQLAGAPPNIDLNGTYHVEQMYVQYFIPAEPRGQLPLLLWHGAWLTGATWETKPDGGEGWLNYFLKRGWPMYVSDAVERGRAGWAMVPEVFATEPLFLTRQNAFERFRIGDGKGSYDPDPAKRKVLPGNQFPVEAFDQFVMQAVPRWTTNNPAIIAAYVELVDKVCPCVVMVHSQSGQFGATVAEMRPDKVKALIMIEPSNSGDLKKAAVLKNTPVLSIFGDYIKDTPRWAGARRINREYLDAVIAAGGSADLIDLPEAGIHGNSHMIMMDRNSDEVAALIQDWLAKHGLYQ